MIEIRILEAGTNLRAAREQVASARMQLHASSPSGWKGAAARQDGATLDGLLMELFTIEGQLSAALTLVAPAFAETALNSKTVAGL